jgi:glycosyltransferase involved in cell wall biosynthesis
MKKLCLGVPVLNCQKETIEFLDKVLKTANFLDEVIIIDNGSYPIIRSVTDKFFKRFDNKINIIRFDHNIGVRPALNEIWKNTEADIIVYTHNDVDFFEDGWDEKVRKAFDEIDNVGIVGAYGAKGLGSQDIYKTDYKMSQLARSVCVSDCPMDMEVHGFRNLENSYENVAVFDGFFMAIKKELLDKTFDASTLDETISGAIVIDEVKQSIGSLFNIPIVISGSVVGVLTVAHLKAGLYKEADMTILYKITGQASEAVSRLQEGVKMGRSKLLDLWVLQRNQNILYFFCFHDHRMCR